MNKFDNDFQCKMESHLIDFKIGKQYLPSKSKKGWLYNDIADNLFPPIRHGFLQYIYDEAMPLHDFINHVRSSQAYCINIFYPVLTQNPSSLLSLLGNKIGRPIKTLIDFQFEHSPETNVLGEWKSDSNKPEEYVTAVDLKIDTKDDSGYPVQFLIETKFTESYFTQCGGFNSGGNIGETRLACENGKELLRDFNLCYLHGSNGKGKLKRTYFNHFSYLLSHFHDTAFSDRCPFIQSHQCLRNHSLVRYYRNSGVDSFFVLMHHELNETIVQEWKKYVDLLQPSSQKELLRITGKEVVDISEIESLKSYYRDRYTLNDNALIT